METEVANPAPPVPLICLLDGRAGHEAQVLGLAEALGRRRPVTIERRMVHPAPWAAPLPAVAWHTLGSLVPGWMTAALADWQILAPLPQGAVVIAAGRRTAPVAAWLTRHHGGRSVQLMAPRMPATAFDLIAAPEHDRLQAPNAVATVGAIGRLTAQTIAAAAEADAARLAALPGPRVAVLVGGPSDSAGFEEADERALLDACSAIAAQGYTLLVTPSRRTPKRLIRALSTALADGKGWVWDGTGENPYPALLGHAEAVLVTADSVSMASEAGASGLPVHLLPLKGLSPKLAAFHRSLKERDITRDFDGTIQRWRYAPLAEADRLAAIVEERLLLQ
ncbi:MAG: mitochondrial fission ELM1 family protein [Pseudomonadota bacterium]